jgi:hypothetical protein
LVEEAGGFGGVVAAAAAAFGRAWVAGVEGDVVFLVGEGLEGGVEGLDGG